MKKVLAVLLVAVMVLSLTACGGGVSTGKYKLSGMTVTEGGQEMDYFEFMKQFGATDEDLENLGYLEIIDDKNAIMKGGLSDDESELTYDDKYFYAKDGSEDERLEYKASGSKITLFYEDEASESKIEMTFKK